MKIISSLFILVMAASLAACSYISTPSFIQKREKHHLGANSAPPLRIPPGLSSQKIHNEYPIAERYYPASSKDINPVPPGLYSPQ